MKKLQSINDPTKYALIDDDVFEIINDMGLKFSIDKRENKGRYFRSTTEIKLPGMAKKKKLLLHHFVYIIKTKTEPSLTIDHIDRNPANNCFSNLRLATIQQQNRHQGKRKNNTSGYIGVCHYHKVSKYKDKTYEYDYWYSSIRRPDNKLEQKYFPYTENGKQHAGKWYDDHAREYFGEFHGELNFQSSSDKQ